MVRNLHSFKTGIDSGEAEKSVGLFTKAFLLFLFLLPSIILAQSFTEDFENGIIPNDWGLFTQGDATIDWSITSDGFEGTSAAYLNPSQDNVGEGNIGSYYLVTPYVLLEDDPYLYFKTKYSGVGDSNTKFKIMISTSPQPDVEDFLVVDEWTAADVEDYLDYKRKAVNIGLSGGFEVYVAFVVENIQTNDDGSGITWYVDNIAMDSQCQGVLPEDISYDEITTTTASIRWSHPSSTYFEVQVVKSGEPIDENGGEYLNTFNYIAADLEPETEYDVYINTICFDDVETGWELVDTFETLPYGMICSEPIVIEGNTYSYSGNTMDFPNSSDLDFDSPGANCLPDNVNENYLNGNRIYFSFTAEEDGLINLDQMTLPWEIGTQCYGTAQSAVLVYDGCDNVGVECLAGLYTSSTDVIERINNLPVEAGHTYIIVISTVFEAEDTSVCFDFNFKFSTCPTPSDISYSNLLQNSVKFSWDNPYDLASEWEYIVLPANQGEPTGNGMITSSNENVEITGLDLATEYNFFVRATCGGDESEWSNAYLFTTQCESFDLPFYADFLGRSEDNPEPCWTIINVDGGRAWEFLPGWDIDNYVSLWTGDNQNFNHDYLISPQIVIEDNDIPTVLRFKQQVSGWLENTQAIYSIRLSTQGIGVDDFDVEIVSEAVLDHVNGWQTVEYELPEGVSGDVNIAWIVEALGTGETANRISFAEIELFEKCDEPSDLAVEDTTIDSALLTWTPGEPDHDEWEVIIMPRGSDAPRNQDSGTIVDTNNYWAEGLDDSSRFEYYVRTSCSETAKSDWVGPIEFHTLCTPVAEPYHETFDLNLDEVHPNNPDTKRYCWSILDENNDGQTWGFTDTTAEIELAQTNDDWLISPAIELNGNFHEFTFMHRGDEDYDLEVWISDSDMDIENFIELERFESIEASSSFTQAQHYFEASDQIYLAIRISPESQASQGAKIVIDDFKIQIADLCPQPIDIEYDFESQTFTWTPGNQETQWEVVLLDASQTVPRNGEIIDQPTYTIDEELEAASEYKFFVRAICDINLSSDWSGPYQFVTACTQVFASPFIETFELDSESINCWIAEGGWLLDNRLNPYEGDYSANIYTWGGETDRWLISPTIEVEEGEMVSFYYKASQYAPTYSEDLRVWLSTNGPSQDEFTTLLIEVNDIVNTDYVQASIALPEDVSGQIHIAFEIPPEISNMYGYRQNLFLDNIEVKPIPSCPEPYNITASAIFDTSFQLSFDTVGAIVDEWEVLVLPYGTENPFDDIDSDNLHVITSNPGMVTGLQPATMYDVYVRPLCSDDETGEWSEKLEVLTRCDSETQCAYTIVLHSGDNNTMGVSGGIDVIQNGYVIETLEFPSGPYSEIVQPVEYQIDFCDGIEFTLHWDSVGWAPNQYPEAYVKVIDPNGDEQWMSEMGIGRPKSDIYTGIAYCTEPSCTQPTDLAVDEMGIITWTPGGNEVQWEVYFQPYELGAIPIEGVLVNEPMYTPTDNDLIHGREGTYEYFVRAICSDEDKSHWSGPAPYILNDDESNAIHVPVNDDDICIMSVDNLTFLGSSPSDDDLSIDLPHNSGDIWVEFEATSNTHHIELGKFSGRHDDAGYSELPRIIMVLYKDNGNGNLEEIAWSDNNVLRTMYGAEVEEGEKYKIRLINTNTEVPNTRMFSICITTIDPCTVNAPNYSFEEPGMISSYTTETMYFDNVIPGWRDNSRVLGGTMFFWGTQNDFFPAYHGGQFVQVPFQDEEGQPEPNPEGDDSVVGIYQDFDTSEITQMDYSYAHRRRFAPMFDDPRGTRIIQLWAGPIGGPYKLISEKSTSDEYWHYVSGKYNVPEEQGKTRFIFRTKSKFGAIVLDGANFVPFNGITSSDHLLTCASPIAELVAEGYGEWTVDPDNPAEVNIEDATSNNTSVSGFAVPGEYVFYWNTRYCQDSVTIVYEGIEDVPEVESPIEYCLGDVAEPLQAEMLEGYTLVFYTEEFGGESQTQIIPDTSEPGATTYYAAYQDTDGCEGGRVPIDVIVNDLTVAIVEFEYEHDTACPYDEDWIPIVADDFTYGGVFITQPEGLVIDSELGVIDIALSEPGNYEVTYTVEADDEICLQANEYTVYVEILEEVSFSIYNFCEKGVYRLGAEIDNAELSSEARFVWTDESSRILGTETTLDVVHAFGGSVDLPTTIHLTIKLGDCEFTEEFLLESAMCEIPKGISPNGDGLNDRFDLSGLSVDRLTIFNRYGTKVYTQNNYTDQWYGQSDNGKDLPDGTYYYVIETRSGESITGWVYINRAY